MAYMRRRKPSRYRRGTQSRRRGQGGDSFAGVTIVQILVTLCVISALYFTTLSGGDVALYVKGQAREAMGRSWATGDILEVMGALGEMTPFQDMADRYLPGDTPVDDGEESPLGEAIFAGNPNADQPMEAPEAPQTRLLPPAVDLGEDAETNDAPANEEDLPGEVTANTGEEVLGSGGMLLMDEGSFVPPENVLTGPVYLSVRLKTPTAGKVTSPFGFRTHPITGKWDFHTGVDIAADKGTDILAALQGTVAEVGNSAIYGKYIVVDHGGNVMTSYSHCDKIIAEEGQRVGMGARIATVGSTGISTGPHLHFELIVDGLKADPLPHLRTAVVS